MHLTNVCQLLIRNEDLLKAEAPLLINMPADDFAKHLHELNPQYQVSIFDNNFANFNAHNGLGKKTYQCQFGHCYQSEITHDLVIIHFPKSKQELPYTLAMIRNNISPDTRILIVGENNGGIKSLAKLGKSHFSYCDKIDAARHCLLFDVTLQDLDTPFILEEWYSHYPIEIGGTSITVAALPGVFSQSKLDVGTKVLLNNLPKHLSGNVLDFGCGAGVIGAYLGKKYQGLSMSLTDVSALALQSARETLRLNQLKGDVFATNSLSNINQQYQHVISNPPFHQGIKTNYQATEQFIAGIHQHIDSRGSLIIVANSFLQYRPLMENRYKRIDNNCQQNGFTVYLAYK